MNELPGNTEATCGPDFIQGCGRQRPYKQVHGVAVFVYGSQCDFDAHVHLPGSFRNLAIILRIALKSKMEVSYQQMKVIDHHNNSHFTAPTP